LSSGVINIIKILLSKVKMVTVIREIVYWLTRM